jgi:hypothetical protein
MALPWNHFVPATLVLYGVSYVWYRYVDIPIRRYLVHGLSPTSAIPENSMGAELIEHSSNSDTDAPKVAEDAPSGSSTWKTGELA